MKRSCNLCFIVLLLFGFPGFSQDLKYSEVDMPNSKDAKKKGMYVTTSFTADDNIRTFIAYDLKKGALGFDVITFDKSGKMISSASEIADKSTAEKYSVTIPDPGTMENPAKGKSIMRLVGATGAAGKMKVQKGYFEPKYATSVEYGPYVVTYTSVLRGYKFRQDNKFKSDTKLNIFAHHVKEEDNIERNYTILEGLVPNTIGYIDANGKASFLGKDARYDKNSPNGSNVITTGIFDGKTSEFDNMKEHILEYNCNVVTNGYSYTGDRAVLLSTLNAPSSISAWKKWQAKGTPYMTYMSFDLQGNVTQNVTFKSKSVRGNFSIYGQDGANYVIGPVNGDHDGYYRFDIGKGTHFQVVKIENGEVVAQEVVSLEELESKMIAPDGEKAKMKSNDLRFFHFEEAPNGDMLAFAVMGSNYHIYQLGTDAKINAFYLVPKLPGKDLMGGGLDILTSGDDMYILIREVDPAISQGLKKKITKGSGYMKNTNFSRVDEYTTYGRLVKINPVNKTCSAPVDIDKAVILGSDPLMPADNGGVLLPLRDSKRNYKLALVK